jgi:hypothetical protein
MDVNPSPVLPSCTETVEEYEKEAARLRIMLYYLRKADIAAGGCKCSG